MTNEKPRKHCWGIVSGAFLAIVAATVPVAAGSKPINEAGATNALTSAMPISPEPQSSGTPNFAQVKRWFEQYDKVRRQAQMLPVERQTADDLMSRPLRALIVKKDKERARELLAKMVIRYKKASSDMQQIAMIPEIAPLHNGYRNFFAIANRLFMDYLKVQETPLVTDGHSSEPIGTGLRSRQQQLTEMEASLKNLDSHLRERFCIAPYKY